MPCSHTKHGGAIIVFTCMHETSDVFIFYNCVFLNQKHSYKKHTHDTSSLPCINSRAGEQEAVQAAVGW